MFLSKNNDMEWKCLAIAAALAAGFAILGFVGVDTFIQPWLRQFDWRIWHWLDIVGSWKILIGLSLVVFACARFARLFRCGRTDLRDSIEKLSANACGAIILAETITGILKICVGRMRPVIFDALGQTGFNPFAMADIWHSFPSGHTAAAFAFLVSIGIMNPRIKWITWTLAIMVGVSRVCVGAHFPADVVVGSFIGMAAADMISAIRKKFIGRIG